MSVAEAVGENPTPNLYERLVAETRRRHRLFGAHLELTYRCNERCSHCYLDVLPPRAPAPDELTAEEWMRVIDEIAALGALHLTMSGGEILVHRDFFRIADHARARRMLLRLFTNGVLVTPAVADRIAALHPFKVEISLYSVHAATHDGITRSAHSWERTTRAFRLLRERGVRTMMKTPLMRENVRELHDLRRLAEDLGAEFRYDTVVTPRDTGDRSPLKHRVSFEDLLWVFRETYQPGAWCRPAASTADRTCGITLNSLLVDPTGTIFPCVQTRIPAGNVRQQALRPIWEASSVWTDLNLTVGDLPVCRTCELRSLCVRCHGLAHVEDGDVRGPALANCREALARRQVLIERGALPADYPIPAHLQDRTSGGSHGDQ